MSDRALVQERCRVEVERALRAAFPQLAPGVVVALLHTELRQHRRVRPGTDPDWTDVHAAVEERLHLRLALRGQ